MTEEQLAEAEEIMSQGYADVECDACGEYVRVEPDGEYPCPECEEGRVVSPLLTWGVI